MMVFAYSRVSLYSLGDGYGLGTGSAAKDKRAG